MRKRLKKFYFFARFCVTPLRVWSYVDKLDRDYSLLRVRSYFASNQRIVYSVERVEIDAAFPFDGSIPARRDSPQASSGQAGLAMPPAPIYLP
jgi:hypothetical protein